MKYSQGIYDDDEEIVTLSGSDFDQLVLNSDQKWFINFYSTHCSHCHHVAPDVDIYLFHEGCDFCVCILVAKNGQGGRRCNSDWCRELFGRSTNLSPGKYLQLPFAGHVSRCIYSLFNICLSRFPKFHPLKRTVYNGPRDKLNLVEFVMQHIDSNLILSIDSKNFDHLSNTGLLDKEKRAWLIDFSGDSSSSHGLSDEKRKILAASLQNLVNLATIDCELEEKLCKILGFRDQLVHIFVFFHSSLQTFPEYFQCT